MSAEAIRRSYIQHSGEENHSRLRAKQTYYS